MPDPVPWEVAAVIIDYLANDITSLKNVALASKGFCDIAQPHIFSTVILDGRRKPESLYILEEAFKDDSRGKILAGYITNLTLLFCDRWFVLCQEEEDAQEAESETSDEISGDELQEIGIENAHGFTSDEESVHSIDTHNTQVSPGSPEPHEFLEDDEEEAGEDYHEYESDSSGEENDDDEDEDHSGDDSSPDIYDNFTAQPLYESEDEYVEGNETEGSAEDEGTDICAIEFISKNITHLRSVHIGPFDHAHLDWHELSQTVRSAITRLLSEAEEIVLDSIANVPLTLFENLRSVKSLEVGHVLLSRVFSNPVAPHFPPSLTSLAVHSGLKVTQFTSMWDMSGFLPIIMHRRYFDFSHLTTLHLHVFNHNRAKTVIQQVLNLCSRTLQDLRLYVCIDNPTDGRLIDLKHLSALQYLTLVADFRGIFASLYYLADTTSSVDVSKTHLKKLQLSIDVPEDHFGRWTDWFMNIVQLTPNTPNSWNMRLNNKFQEIFKAWDDTTVRIEFPPWPPRSPMRPSDLPENLSILMPVAQADVARGRFDVVLRKESPIVGLTLRNEQERALLRSRL